MSGGGWFDWLPGFLGGAGSGAGAGAMPPEMFGPKAPAAAPDTTGMLSMVPGLADPAAGVSQTSSFGGTKGWRSDLASGLQRYRQAQSQGAQQQAQAGRQRMTEWFGPRRIG